MIWHACSSVPTLLCLFLWSTLKGPIIQMVFVWSLETARTYMGLFAIWQLLCRVWKGNVESWRVSAVNRVPAEWGWSGINPRGAERWRTAERGRRHGSCNAFSALNYWEKQVWWTFILSCWQLKYIFVRLKRPFLASLSLWRKAT